MGGDHKAAGSMGQSGYWERFIIKKEPEKGQPDARCVVRVFSKKKASRREAFAACFTVPGGGRQRARSS